MSTAPFVADSPVSAERRHMMRSVRRRNTTPEMIVRAAIRAAGVRYQLHVRNLPGTPDIVMFTRRIAIFVHGCFWHRHSGCRLTTTPKTRTEFWAEKFRRNQERDAAALESLRELGWQVAIVWECETKSGTYLEPLLQRLATAAPEKSYPRAK
jgi:DNA mismatch endonuclease (patch repair protein)